MKELYIYIYNFLKDFAVPILAVLFSWIVARHSAKRGAELGAQAASELEREKATEALRTQQIGVLNRAIFGISMQINDLSVWWRHISKNVDDKTAWLSLDAFEDIISKDIVIPVENLGFLWSDSETSAHLLFDLSIAQSQYEHARASMNERSRFHREVVQPKVAEIATVRDSKAGLVGFELSRLPWDLVEKAQRNTLNVFEHVAKTLVNHEQLLQRLTQAAKQHFPDTRFVRVKAPQDVTQGAQEYLRKLAQ
jgi:hypothetical protein